MNKFFPSEIKINSAEKYFRKFLQIAPLSVAIWRAIEARYLSTVKLPHPILDIGCGFGEFALGGLDTKVDVGIDIATRDLEVAKHCGKYKKVVLGDARRMPFKDETFSSIFSISTFEHIPNPQKVIQEAYRVLKRGGILVATIETDAVDRQTFYRGILEKIGLQSTSKFLLKKYNHLFHRDVIVNKNVWLRYIKDAGFSIERSEDIISPSVVKIYDFFMITAWLSQIPRPIIGKRIVYRPAFITNILTKIFLPFMDKKETNGTNLFIVARKPSRRKDS